MNIRVTKTKMADQAPDPKAKNTKIDLKSPELMGAMGECLQSNAKNIMSGFIQYIKTKPKKPYVYMLDLLETKTPDQISKLPPYRGGRIPSLLDLLMEAISVLQCLASDYNVKCTLQTTLIKTKFVYCIYGEWENEEEKAKAGLDMIRR